MPSGPRLTEKDLLPRYIVVKVSKPKQSNKFMVGRKLRGTDDEFVPTCYCDSGVTAKVIMEALAQYEESQDGNKEEE